MTIFAIAAVFIAIIWILASNQGADRSILISPRKNGHLTKRPFVPQKIQGLHSQVWNEDVFDYSIHRCTQIYGF